MNTDGENDGRSSQGARGPARRAVLWSAVTCHRFCAGDLSPSNRRTHPISHACPRWREPWTPRCFTDDFLGSTATSRLEKAVTSHRTPNAERLRWRRAVIFIRVHPRPSVVSRSPLLTNRCERSRRDSGTPKHVRLPRPVRHERGEGRGEGCFTIPSGSTVRGASSPRPSPPFRTEEREAEIPVRTVRTFAVTDTAN